MAAGQLWPSYFNGDQVLDIGVEQGVELLYTDEWVRGQPLQEGGTVAAHLRGGQD